jgi:nucleoside-diphosphate-sugar epimerase
MTVLITGASGFVGRAILAAASKCGIYSRPVFRSTSSAIDCVGEGVMVPTIDSKLIGL